MWTPKNFLTGEFSVRKSVRLISNRFDIYLTDFLTEQRNLLILLTPMWLTLSWAIRFCFYSVLRIEFSLLPNFQVPKTLLSPLYPWKNFAWKHGRSTGRSEIKLKWWEYLVPISFASFSLLELCEICEPKQVIGPQLRNRYLNCSPF